MSAIRNIKIFVKTYSDARKKNLSIITALGYTTAKCLSAFFKVRIIDYQVETSQCFDNSSIANPNDTDTLSEVTNQDSQDRPSLLADTDDAALFAPDTVPGGDTVFSKDCFNREINVRLIRTKQSHPFESEKTFIWFVPNCSNVWGGGHYTIFRFANYFANQYRTRNIIFLYDYTDNSPMHPDKLCKDLREALPNCLIEVFTSLSSLPACDAVIATTWQSAYFVDDFNKCHQKFYFMQDYESLFYPAGTKALQANYTYTFGFIGITGGHWLRSIFESYGGKAQEYIFCADKSIFYPGKKSEQLSPVKRLFFYGRPSTERRAFELGMATLELVAEYYPDIEIVIAGLDGLHKPAFPCVLKGNLSLKETGDLYRTCDIGMALSATNLSYLPVELMASGCPVVTNGGPQVEWFCKNNFNALIASPTPTNLFKAVSELIQNQSLRAKLIENGLQTTSARTWEGEIDKTYHYIVDNITVNPTFDYSKKRTAVISGSPETIET